MSVILPSKLEHFRHDEIVHLIKQLNSQYKLPHRGSWGQGVPDLEEPITRQVVEVAIARDLKTVWGQCVYYYRMGASHIHLVLSPRLFHNYKKNECTFVRENPIPNVKVYVLPDTRLPFRVSHKAKISQKHSKPDVSKHVPIWPFLVDKLETVPKPKTKSTIEKDFITQANSISDLIEDDDTNLVIEPSLLSDPTKEVHYEGNKPLCVNCKTGSGKNEMVFCRKYGWIILKELASKQRLCAF